MDLEIFENTFAKCIVDRNEEILYLTWFESTRNMRDKDYKDTMRLYLEKYNENVPDSLKGLPALIDFRKFFFGIHPELQEWTNKKIFPYFKGDQINAKIAILASEGFIAQLSIEQLTENVNFQHFSLEEKAKIWVKS